MMPSLDHCIGNSQEMTTLTKTLEVFDTYKHRDDKDSDEESFHLPLDDDEVDTKIQEPARNGSDNEKEDEILDKFDSTVAYDHIDPQTEESLLDDVEDKVNGYKHSITEGDSPEENGDNGDELKDCLNANNDKIVGMHIEGDNISEQENSSSECLSNGNERTKEEDLKKDVDKVDNSEEIVKDVSPENYDVPKLDIEKQLGTDVEASSAIDDCDKYDAHLEVNSSPHNPKISKPSLSEDGESTTTVNQSKLDEEVNQNAKLELENNATQVQEDKSSDKPTEKCENSNDSVKHHNDDSEDLFDISIIRDAEEDNAENAYNEAHGEDNNAEENEDYDDKTDEKVDEDSNTEKVNHLEEEDMEEEIDIEKHDEHLKSDDVEIEEDNLKLDCDGVKETVSEGENENTNRTETGVTEAGVDKQISGETAVSVDRSVTECRLDEVTGQLVSADKVEVTIQNDMVIEDNVTKDLTNEHEDAQAKKSLKRTISDDADIETGASKKSRVEETVDVEIKEVEKPKEKLPLRTLLSLSDFMKTRKYGKRLSIHDLEEFCIQKMCEVIVHKSDLGDVHHQLKLQEQLIETMRKEIQQLTKQARDLEIVNKKLMNDLKQQTATQKPLNPLKITRSVGLQVKFTPAFENFMKRRQPNATIPNQKVSTQTPGNRGPRTASNTLATTPNRQAPSPQKQQPQLPKPNTPLLSQALQNRRGGANDINSKISNQAMRPKTIDPKTGAPTASVIDLTDEDDKKDKNKNSPPKMVSPKSITVPLRTTPMRVNATTQGIRLTTSQGKVSPITSVVTSSAPQVMYVVHSSSQNVLTSSLGPKAVVVNLQSANGVLPSTLNGSAVSVIPKQPNTIQLKTVAPPPKAAPNNKVVKMANKHPAPLPAPPIIRISSDKPLKPIPPKPHLTIRKTDTGIILQWKMPYELEMYEVIASYQLYAYQETSALPSTDMWRKVGDVKALALPMACTLTQFADKNKYYFAVRPVDIHKRIGMFSEPEEISL